MTNEEYIQHKKLFKYAESIVYTFYTKNKVAFKSISMDYKDLKQEANIVTYQIIDEYKEKYMEEDRIYLEIHIKEMVTNMLKKLIRDNIDQQFVSINQESQENFLSDMNEKEPETKLTHKYCPHCNTQLEFIFKKKKYKLYKDQYILYCSTCKREVEKTTLVKIHPNQIPSAPKEKSLSIIEIKKLLKKYSYETKEKNYLDVDYKNYCNERNYDLMCYKILDGNTYKKIKERMGISRGRAMQIYNIIIKRIKKYFINPSQLFDL